MKIVSSIIKGLLIVSSLLYLLFCMFLTCVALPYEKNKGAGFQFSEQPKGFIKWSRYVGIGIMWTIILGIVLGLCYAIGS